MILFYYRILQLASPEQSNRQKFFVIINKQAHMRNQHLYRSSSCSSCIPIHQCALLAETASTSATISAYEQCNYLSQLNYKLVNQINDVQTEKYFYRNRLNQQHRTHSSELQQTYKIINQKNTIILYMEQNVDKLKKEYRVLQSDYLCLKNNSQAQKQYFRKEIENIQNKCKQKIKNIQKQLQRQYQQKVNRRVQQVTRECQARIQTYKQQINMLTQNAKQVTHELKLSQDQYREMLLKNDTMMQQTIHRQLRKRDYEAQNNYLRDVSQYQALLNEKKQLKQQMNNLNNKYELLKKKNNQVESLLETQKTKYEDLLQAFQGQRQENQKLQKNNFHLNRKHADTTQIDTNTDQPYLPVVMPVDLDLISEIVALKQFVVQKIVERFLQFFVKSSTTDPKKKSLSLTTFKNSLQLLKQLNPQNKILLHIQANLDRIVRLYCPSMNYNRQYLTVKDQFIKRTLMQCETITNPTQKLYRILQLINRLRNPIGHVKSEISAGQLRLVELKLLQTLKKVLNQ